jgi:hypothetical protein
MDLESLLPEYSQWFARWDLSGGVEQLALRGAAERHQTLAEVAARIEAAAGERAAFNGLSRKTGQLRLPFDMSTRPIRPLFRPNEPMRLIQRLMVAWFRFLDWEMGRPHGSVAHNLYRLRGSRLRFLYRVDLAGAYGAVPIERLAQMLVTREVVQHFCPPLARGVVGIENFLWQYSGHPDGGLVQGGAASPYLFDRYVRETLDMAFWWTDGRSGPADHEELFGQPSWTYANQLRYLRLADDLTFASRYPIGKHKRRWIMQVIRAAGFEPSPKKTRQYDLAQKAVVINGAGLQWTSNGRIRTFMPAERRRALEGLLHRALERGDVPEDVVHGHMGWFYQLVDRSRMSASEQRIERLYRRFVGRKRSAARADQEAQSGRAPADEPMGRQIADGRPSDWWQGWGDEPVF